MLPISATTGRGLNEIGPWLFRALGIVRVYTKLPGKPADRERPFTLRQGQTVRDVARLVHKDLERTLRYARVIGHSGFDGQHVGPEHRAGRRRRGRAARLTPPPHPCGDPTHPGVRAAAACRARAWSRRRRTAATRDAWRPIARAPLP